MKHRINSNSIKMYDKQGSVLFGESADPAERRRNSAKTGRLLRLFKDHNLLYRVKGTHRYQLTAHGHRTLPGLVSIRNTNTQKLQEIAL